MHYCSSFKILSTRKIYGLSLISSLDHASLLNEICSLKKLKSASIDKDTNIYNRRKYIEMYKNKEIPHCLIVFY